MLIRLSKANNCDFFSNFTQLYKGNPANFQVKEIISGHIVPDVWLAIVVIIQHKRYIGTQLDDIAITRYNQIMETKLFTEMDRWVVKNVYSLLIFIYIYIEPAFIMMSNYTYIQLWLNRYFPTHQLFIPVARQISTRLNVYNVKPRNIFLMIMCRITQPDYITPNYFLCLL